LKKLILIIVLLLPFTANAGGLMMSSGTSAAAAGTACTPHDISADANLVGLWYLENNGNDETTSGNNLSLTGNITYGTSTPTPKQGTYWADSPGSTGSYLSISDASQTGLDTGTNISMGGWVYIDVGNIISAKHGGAGDYGWMLAVTTGAWTWYWSTTGSDWSNVATAALGLSTATWYHIIFVYDGSYQRMYKDGVELTSGGFPAAYSTNWNNSTNVYALGGRTSGNIFDGKYDEWFYTKDALTDSEISDIYNCGFTP